MAPSWFHRKKEARTAGDRPLVVIMDDEVDLCEVLRLTLERDGYNVAMAHDGASGLELVRRERPAAVLLDIKMPRMNGYQVLARLQQDQELGCMPVVIITSMTVESDRTDEEWARRLDVARVISKPFEPEVVSLALRQVLASDEADSASGEPGIPAATAGAGAADEDPLPISFGPEPHRS